MLNTYLVNEHYVNYAPSSIVIEILHTILNGSYHSRAYPINTFFLMSADIDGAQIDSEGTEDTEYQRSGERIDFRFVPQVNNQTDLDALVVSLIAQQRLLSKTGAIMIPWNCGQEMHDVIKITDTPCNQADDTLRVMGMRTVYDPKNSIITLNLILVSNVAKGLTDLPIFVKFQGSRYSLFAHTMWDAVLPYTHVPCFDFYYENALGTSNACDRNHAWYIRQGRRQTQQMWLTESSYSYPPVSASMTKEMVDASLDSNSSAVFLFGMNVWNAGVDGANLFDATGDPIANLETLMANLGDWQASI